MILLIAEKPSQAETIAKNLSSSLSVSYQKDLYGKSKVPRYVLKSSPQIVVVPSLGHLLKHTWTSFPSPKDLPKWEYPDKTEIKASTKEFFTQIKTYSKQASEIVCACDLDEEGSYIFYELIDYLKPTAKISRMVFNSLSKSDLKKAFDSRKPFDKTKEGLLWSKWAHSRHIIDFLIGMNFSMKLRIHSGENLSAGRVQTPLLSELVDKERSIESFVPKTYYEIHGSIVKDGKTYEVSSDRIDKKEDAEKALKSFQKRCVVSSYDETKKVFEPILPLSLSDLIKETSSVYNFSPKQTQSAAQSLYQKGLISYPRTSSTAYPPGTNFTTIFQEAPYPGHVPKVRNEPFQKGGTFDGSHLPIHPVGMGSLTGKEEKVYDLILRAFYAGFCESATTMYRRVVFSSPNTNITLILKGSEILSPGYWEIYPYHQQKINEVPSLSKGEVVSLVNSEVVEKQTQPPKRYTQHGAIAWMKRVGIGTEATRVDILEKMISRNYITSQIKALDASKRIVDALSLYVPQLTQPKLTSKLQLKLDSVKNPSEFRTVIEEYIKEFDKSFNDIDKNIPTFEKSLRKNQPLKNNVVGPCECGGSYFLRYSNRTKNYYIQCDKDNTHWLPSWKTAKDQELKVSEFLECPVHPGFKLIKRTNSTGRKEFCPVCLKEYFESKKR